MYVRTIERLGLGLGQPPRDPQSQQPALLKTFTSSVIAYKDSRGQCQSTKCLIYVPTKLRNQPKIDVLVFFHGLLDVCDNAHNFDPVKVAKRFRLDDQVEMAAQQATLVVPIILWNSEDRRSGIIRAAWSAAYLNALVEEVLAQINESSRVRPELERLILAGHSAAYDILTPLADQFDCGVQETKKGALAKLHKVLVMDTIYRTQDAKALERWAGNLFWDAEFTLVLGNSVKADQPPAIWKRWIITRGKGELPGNLKVLKTSDGHCELPGNYVRSFLEGRLPVAKAK